MENKLLFYLAYENFYQMARESTCFAAYCKEAFGEDFSQDGFSDFSQVDLILPHIPSSEDLRILDIGCGNGKMLKYLQIRTGAHIFGFDFSQNAIASARLAFPDQSDFQVGVIGEIEYPNQTFDAVISMDTLYFAEDMTAFVGQVKNWMKMDGVFFIGYQEGDIMKKTRDRTTAVLAKALEYHGFQYHVQDLTEQPYYLMNLYRRSKWRSRTSVYIGRDGPKKKKDGESRP